MLSPEKAAEVPRLHHRIITTLRFIEEAGPFRYGDRFREVTERAVARNDLRGLRQVVREVEALTIALPKDKRAALSAALTEVVGDEREAERVRQLELVEMALARGTVASEKERKRLELYLDELEADNEDPNKIAALRALLSR